MEKKINLALADKITEFSNVLLAAHAKLAHANSERPHLTRVPGANAAPGAHTKIGPCTRSFCTCVHRFAQGCDQILIDEEKENHYCALQIEPGSLRTLRVNLDGGASLTAATPRD
jgi:hypothetical protein